MLSAAAFEVMPSPIRIASHAHFTHNTTSLCCCCISTLHCRLALLVHPDKANQNGHNAYKAVFEEAFKVLNSANDLLSRVASGEAIPGLAQQQQQQQGAAAGAAAAPAGGAAGFGAGGFPGASGFAGGFAAGGFPAGTTPGAGGRRYYYAYVPPGFANAYGAYAGAWAPRR
jgi:hypothetical protein